MKICYIISTCDAYLNTRVKYQSHSFLKYVDKNDVYYLTSKPNHDIRYFGFNAPDDFENITWKYIFFIYYMNISHLYDWYIFIDDDTFVFTNRLEQLLSSYNNPNTENYYIGHELDHIKNDFGLYMSGGAGYAISQSLYLLIDQYVKTAGIQASFKHWCDDLCIGLWIQEIAKTHSVNQIHNKHFHMERHSNDLETDDLNTAITYHKVMEQEHYDYYTTILDKEILDKEYNETVFVIVTDFKYSGVALHTINELRNNGNWANDVVLITIDFDLTTDLKQRYNIIEKKFTVIDKTNLIDRIGKNGFSNSDKRELIKLNQWEKFHVFDDYFTKWQRVIFLDAGLRIFDDVKYLLELDYKNKILAPNDAAPYYPDTKIFRHQLSFDNSDMIDLVKTDYGEEILNSQYFLNCIWIYDTNILKICNKTQLIDAMNKYVLCKTNEMGIMNLLFHFKYKLWTPFPIKNSNDKFLFEWCELNHSFPTSWNDYCCIKYSVSMPMHNA